MHKMHETDLENVGQTDCYVLRIKYILYISVRYFATANEV